MLLCYCFVLGQLMTESLVIVLQRGLTDLSEQVAIHTMHENACVNESGYGPCTAVAAKR